MHVWVVVVVVGGTAETGLNNQFSSAVLLCSAFVCLEKVRVCCALPCARGRRPHRCRYPAKTSRTNHSLDAVLCVSPLSLGLPLPFCVYVLSDCAAVCAGETWP